MSIKPNETLAHDLAEMLENHATPASEKLRAAYKKFETDCKLDPEPTPPAVKSKELMAAWDAEWDAWDERFDQRIAALNVIEREENEVIVESLQ